MAVSVAAGVGAAEGSSDFVEGASGASRCTFGRPILRLKTEGRPSMVEIFCVTLAALYFAPFMVAAGREHDLTNLILVANALLGWSGSGGTHLPGDVVEKLSELRNLIESHQN